jgi:tetratricopeptide (TPR) repeat protein
MNGATRHIRGQSLKMKLILRRFPVLVASVALLVYLLTMSSGVTVGSLGLTAKVAGWDWLPMAGQPLFWFLTLPARCLPAGWAAPALNLFAAACGAATLGVLARSLELLPWLRPLENLMGWNRRIPVLVSVVVCGLELHFWENSTAATGEILELLLFAAAVWCVLEFRANKNPRWLHASVFIWGLGMAENWMMLLALPLFVFALLWMKTRSFLRWQFVVRLACWGLAGFSIYALLPTLNGLSPHSPWSMGDSWVLSLKQTRQQLGGIYFQFWRAHRLSGMTVLIFYLVPVLACLVRLPDEETKNKSALDRFQIWFMRALRAVLMAFSVWLAFNPVIGPRGILTHQMNFALPLLSFDYLNGLAAGFLAGNLLLIYRKNESPARRVRAGARLAQGLESAAFPVVSAMMLLTTLGLIALNGPAITLANREPLSQFGELALRSLPPGGGMVLSDNPGKLAAFQAAQARHPGARDWLAVDVRSLPAPEYREKLERQRPGLWLQSINRHTLSPLEMAQLAGGLLRSNRVFYLQPGFGYLFEFFYLEPVGSVYEMKPFQTNAVNPPALTAARIDQNEEIWDEFAPHIASLQAAGEKNGLAKLIENRLHFDAVATGKIPQLREWFSMALDAWGVELQRAARLPSAQRRFTQALELNTDNWVARTNLICNSNLQAGNKMGMADSANLAGQLGSGSFLSRFGPVDEPAFCFLLGCAFRDSDKPRQAMQQFERAAALAPEKLDPRLALASLYTSCRLVEPARSTIARLHTELKNVPEAANIETALSLLEANLCLSQTNLDGARRIYQSILAQHPGDARVEKSIMQAYVAIGDFTNAEKVVTGMLERKPDDISALLAKSDVLIRTGREAESIPVLDHILAITNSVPAKINRAFAHLQSTNYAAAKADYAELQDPFLANLGLADVALRQGDTNQAVQCFTKCLSHVSPASPEWIAVRARLDALVQSPLTESHGNK